MLDLGLVNLRSPAELLEDHSPETGWWFDPRSDDCDPFIDPAYADVEMEEESPWERGLVRIDTIPSREAYGDMEVFIGRVRDPRARDLLERAIAGRGASKTRCWSSRHCGRHGLRSTTPACNAGRSGGWPTRD